MRRIYIALMTILAAGTAARAQEVKRMSLQDCMDYAMKNNYTVKNAQLDILIQKAQNDQTVAIALPQVTGKADLNYFINPQKQFIAAKSFVPTAPDGLIMPIAFSLNYASSASLSASQILFDGSVAVALQARNALMEMARQKSKISETGVRYGIMRSYYGHVVVKNQLEIVKKTARYLRDLQQEIVKTNAAGLVEKIEVERLTVQVNNLQTDSIRLENLVVLTEQTLKYQIGMDINMPLELTEMNIDRHIEDAAKLLNEELVYTKLPEYNTLTTAVQLNQYNIKRYKMAALPTIAAFGSYGTNYGENKFSKLFDFKRFESYSLIGVQLTSTIFGGMKRLNELKEAKLDLEKTQNNLEDTKRALSIGTIQIKTNLRNSLLQIQTQRNNMALAEDVLDLAQKKYRAGVGSNSEVTQAQTELLKTQNTYFSTMVDIVNGEADLKKALGLL